MGRGPEAAPEGPVLVRDHQHATRLLNDGERFDFPVMQEELHIRVPGDSVNQLHVSEVLSGYVFEADDWFNDMIDKVKDLPEDQRPDEVITGGLVAGPFIHTQKSRREGLKPGMRDLDSQLKAARGKIDRLRELDVPVVYNMGPDDIRTAEDLAVDKVRQIIDLGKEGDADLSVDQLNHVKGHPIYQDHLAFMKRVAYPYMLHAGRTLRTRGQVAAMDGHSHQPEDEYFTLWNAYKRVQQGKSLTARDRALLDVDAFNQSDFTIIRDGTVVTETDGRKVTDDIYSFIGFSAEPQYQQPMAALLKDTETEMADGQEVSNGRFMQHYHEFIALNMGDTWLVNNGSGIHARQWMKADGQFKNIKSDLAARLNTTRRRAHPPMAHMITRTDEGSTGFALLNPVLMDKADSIDRTHVLYTCDHQIGSITARADVLAQEIGFFIDNYVLGSDNLWSIQMAGDMSHGRNYPDFPAESQSTMLMAMDSQLRFNQDMWEYAMHGLPPEVWGRMLFALIQPGNHEWNSGTDRWHGYSFTNDLVNAFRLAMMEAGISRDEAEAKISTHDAVATASGAVAKAFTGVADYGAYRTLNQHYLLARGGKGGGGSPVQQAYEYMAGGADIMKDIDMFGAGHWHHGACACYGNKAGWIAPAKADLSGYELWRGYRPGMGSMILSLGGGLPVVLEYISEAQLRNHVPQSGKFGATNLAEMGYRDDDGYHPMHSSMRDSRLPRSALMKAIRALEYKHGERWATRGPILDGKHLPPGVFDIHTENGKHGLPYFVPEVRSAEFDLRT